MSWCSAEGARSSGVLPACWCDFPTYRPDDAVDAPCSAVFADAVREEYDALQVLLRVMASINLAGYVILLWQRHLKRSAKDVHKFGFWSAQWMRTSVDAQTTLLGILNAIAMLYHARNIRAQGLEAADPRLSRLNYLFADVVVSNTVITMLAVVVHRWSLLLRKLHVRTATRVEGLVSGRVVAAIILALWTVSFGASAGEIYDAPHGNPTAAVLNLRWRGAKFLVMSLSLGGLWLALAQLKRALDVSVADAGVSSPPVITRMARIIRFLRLTTAVTVPLLGLLGLSMLFGSDTYYLIEPRLDSKAWLLDNWWVPLQLLPHVPIIGVTLYHHSSPVETVVSVTTNTGSGGAAKTRAAAAAVLPMDQLAPGLIAGPASNSNPSDRHQKGTSPTPPSQLAATGSSGSRLAQVVVVRPAAPI